MGLNDQDPRLHLISACHLTFMGVYSCGGVLWMLKSRSYGESRAIKKCVCVCGGGGVAWTWLEYIFMCFACCQHFYLSDFCFLSLLNFIFFLQILLNNKVVCVKQWLTVLLMIWWLVFAFHIDIYREREGGGRVREKERTDFPHKQVCVWVGVGGCACLRVYVWGGGGACMCVCWCCCPRCFYLI